MQTAGGGLQVIRSVEFQERGELENTCTLHTWSHPRCCCLFCLFCCLTVCGKEWKVELLWWEEKMSSYSRKLFLQCCLVNILWCRWWLPKLAPSSKPSLPDSVVLWWFEEKGGHLVFQTDRNSGEVIRWLGNFSIWPFQTLALSGKDWSDQETFDLNSTSHYRLPGNIFAVLFK